VHAKEHTPSSDGSLISTAIRDVERQVKTGLLLHWIVDESGQDDGIPVLAIASNTSPKLMALATPERIQALNLLWTEGTILSG